MQPSTRPPTTHKGNVLYREGHKEQAKQHYQKAVKLFPKHVYAWSNLGTVLRYVLHPPTYLEIEQDTHAPTQNRELGELPASVDAHKQALALLPKARNHYNLAVSYQSMGKLLGGWLNGCLFCPRRVSLPFIPIHPPTHPN